MDRIRQFYFNKSEYLYSTYPNLSVIIGRASKGPIFTPIFAKELTDIIRLREVFGEENELISAFIEACDGKTNICLVNIEGEYSSLDIGNLFHIESLDINKEYDKENKKEIEVIFNNNIIGFKTKDSNRYIEYELLGETLNTLSQKINNDSLLGLNPVVIDVPFGKDHLPASVLIEELNKMNNYILSKNKEDFLNKESKLKNFFHELTTERIDSISILNYNFYDKFKKYFNIVDLSKSNSVLYGAIINDELENISFDLTVEDEDERYFNINDIIYFDEENSFKVIAKKGNHIFIINNDIPSITSIDYLKDNFRFFYMYSQSIYSMFDDLIKEYNKLGDNFFINIGVKQEEEFDYNKFIDFYFKLREKEKIQNTQIFNPFINIIIDKYKTSIFNSNNPIYSNGVPFLLYAINNVNEYDNIIGTINSLFMERAFAPAEEIEDEEIEPTERELLSDIEIEELSSFGYITCCLHKNKYRINSGKNLAYDNNPILGNVGNSILLHKITKDITNIIDLEMSDIAIKNSISQVLTDVYSDVISDFKIDISSFIENKNTISKTVTMDISIYGYIQSVSLNIEVR